MIEFFLAPTAIANVLAVFFFGDHSNVPLSENIITGIETLLVVLGIYPRIFKFNRRVGAFVFYVILNLITNLVFFIWFASGLDL